MGIWSLVDLIITLTGNAKGKDGRSLEGYPENKKKAWIITGIVWAISITLATVTTAAVMNRIDNAAAAQSAAENRAITPGAAGDAGSLTVRMDIGHTARVSVLNSAYVTQYPGDPLYKPLNGGFLLVEVSWETLTGSTPSNPSYFKAYGADGKPITGTTPDKGGFPLVRDVPVGQSTHGLIAWDTKNGPTTIVITDVIGNKATTFTLTPPAA